MDLLIYILWIGIPAVGAVITSLISYSLWGLKRWGRWLIIGVYGLVLGGIVCAVVAGRMGRTEASILAALLVGILTLCLLPQVRATMSR